jgi:DNA polymerase III delta prime subunit
MAEKRYQKLEEIPDYAKEIIEDLIKSDIIKGTGEGLNLTEDMLRVIVICYRMALTNANNIYQLAKTLGGETK